VTISLNGEPREVADGATVLTAVEVAGVPAGGRGVAVAVDGEVVPQAAWPDTRLTEGQAVEVLHAVQGGN
jgi:sulfur carrier protein